jgi:hypothetical protein
MRHNVGAGELFNEVASVTAPGKPSGDRMIATSNCRTMEAWSPWTHCGLNGGRESSGSPGGAAHTVYACSALWPAVKALRLSVPVRNGAILAGESRSQ